MNLPDWIFALSFLFLGALGVLLALGLNRALNYLRRPTASTPVTTLYAETRQESPTLQESFPSQKTPLERLLSAREWEVARLVEEGKRNAEIARTLHLSVFTVENHLKKIYRKLHIHSRHELARQVREDLGRQDSPPTKSG